MQLGDMLVHFLDGRVHDLPHVKTETIVTHIINYVPRRLLTLQAEITDNFPEFMKSQNDWVS